MNCPKCQGIIIVGDRCPYCGFNLEDIEQLTAMKERAEKAEAACVEKDEALKLARDWWFERDRLGILSSSEEETFQKALSATCGQGLLGELNQLRKEKSEGK